MPNTKQDEVTKEAARVARELAGPRGANKAMPPEETTVNAGAKDAEAARKGGKTAEAAAEKEAAKDRDESEQAQSGPQDLSALQSQIRALQARLDDSDRAAGRSAAKEVRKAKKGELVASRRGWVAGQGIIEPNELIPEGTPVGSWMKKAPKFDPDVEPLDELAVDD